LSLVHSRWVWILLLTTGLLAGPAQAATGRVLKVLPQFLDRQGRTSLSPSLYERDAYQATLRNHPDRRSGLRFYVHWKIKGPAWEPLKLRFELRGVAEGQLPRQIVLEEPLINRGSRFNRWAQVTLDAETYKRLGAVTAWRVTLWEGQKQIGAEQSFMW
jgi:hypothetical protein